jgi:hypothetical protein
MIQKKQYFIVIYVKDIVYGKNEDNNTYFIKIALDGIGLNRDNQTATANVTYTGTTNTTNGIASQYVTFFNNAVELLLYDFSYIVGFNNCSLNVSTIEFNSLNRTSLESKNVMNFSFDILDLVVNRQGQQTLNVFVNYQYNIFYENFDYEPLREYIISILESTIDDLTKWEYLVIFIAQTAYMKYKAISGIKIQIVVESNPNGYYPEPGDHGPTYVYGEFV